MNFTHSKRNSIQKIYKNQFDSIYNPPGTNLPAYLNFIPLPSLASATFLPNASLNAAIFSFFGTAANTADTRFHPLTKSMAPGTMPAYVNTQRNFKSAMVMLSPTKNPFLFPLFSFSSNLNSNLFNQYANVPSFFNNSSVNFFFASAAPNATLPITPVKSSELSKTSSINARRALFFGYVPDIPP